MSDPVTKRPDQFKTKTLESPMPITPEALASFRRLTAPLPTVSELPPCSVVGCDSGSDPRGCIRVGEIRAPACDGHWGTHTDVILRDPLPRWPRRIADVGRAALDALPILLDEIDRLRAVIADAKPAIAEMHEILDGMSSAAGRSR